MGRMDIKQVMANDIIIQALRKRMYTLFSCMVLSLALSNAAFYFFFRSILLAQSVKSTVGLLSVTSVCCSVHIPYIMFDLIRMLLEVPLGNRSVRKHTEYVCLCTCENDICVWWAADILFVNVGSNAWVAALSKVCAFSREHMFCVSRMRVLANFFFLNTKTHEYATISKMVMNERKIVNTTYTL